MTVKAVRRLTPLLLQDGYYLAHCKVAGTSSWAETAKSVLKAELKRRNVGYRELAEKLTAMGSPETERNIANKISRGGFTAAFFLQCLEAIGVKDLRLG